MTAADFVVWFEGHAIGTFRSYTDAELAARTKVLAFPGREAWVMAPVLQVYSDEPAVHQRTVTVITTGT